MMKRMAFLGLACLLVPLAVSSVAVASTFTAYEVNANTPGNQAWAGPLGMAFDVNSPILVTALGAFDSAGDGWAGDSAIVVTLFSRTTQTAVASLVFDDANPGALDGGSRFLSLSQPLFLEAGFQGMIVAKGYGAATFAEYNGNTHGATPTAWHTDSGGGALSFVGSSYYGSAGDTYPGITDGGPANRYAAGTFQFAPVPEPLTMASAFLAISSLGMYLRKRTKTA